MRALPMIVLSLFTIVPIDKNQQLVDFLKSIKETPELNKTYEYIQKDSITGSSDIIVMDQS